MDLRWYEKMTYQYNNGTDREQYEKKHLLPHPYKRLSILIVLIILAGVLANMLSGFHSEAEINATVEFLKAGGYEEEYYTTGYCVEFSSPDETITVEYMMEDVVLIYADGTGYTTQAAASMTTFKQYGINFETMLPDEIYEKLSQHGYSSYKVYQKNN